MNDLLDNSPTILFITKTNRFLFTLARKLKESGYGVWFFLNKNNINKTELKNLHSIFSESFEKENSKRTNQHSYVIFIGHFTNDEAQNISTALDISKRDLAKPVFIFLRNPNEHEQATVERILSNKDLKPAVICIDKSRLPAESSFLVGKSTYASSSNDVVSDLIKIIFSLKAYGAINLIISENSNRGESINQKRPIPKKPRLIRRINERLGQDIKKGIRVSKHFVGGGVVILFLLPLLLIIANAITLYFIKMALINGDFRILSVSTSAAKTSINLLDSFHGVVGHVPQMNNVYSSSKRYSGLSRNVISIADRGEIVVLKSFDLVGKILQDNQFNISRQSRDLQLELERMYLDIGLLNGEIGTSTLESKLIENVFLSKSELSLLNKGINKTTEFMTTLPAILGSDREVTYAVLIQDDSHLKATGGQATIMVLMSFSGGRLVNYEPIPLSNIDKLVVGEIEAPEPLKLYESSDNWRPSSANWYPDFESSAKSLEWFLNNTADTKIDGVVAINADLLTRLAEELLPREHYSLDQESGNVDEVNSMIEKSIASYVGVSSNKKTKLARMVKDGLASKDIQVYTSDPKAQAVLETFGFTGRVGALGCDGNCYSDIAGVYETQIDNGQISSKIKREAKYAVWFEEKVIKRRLIINLKNPSGDTSDYKAYMRVVTPEDAGFAPVILVRDKSEEETTSHVYTGNGYKEIGSILDISAGEEIEIIYQWESGTEINFSETGEYFLTVRKQSGLDKLPFDMHLRFPSNVRTGDRSSLTVGGEFLYNTEMTRDFTTRLYW